jgi:hypothetical protein
MQLDDRASRHPQKTTEPKPYWIERLPSGQKLFCFVVRRHDKKLALRPALEPIEKELMDS